MRSTPTPATEVLAQSSGSPAATAAAGEAIAELVRPGDVVLLCGDLGSGKTVLVGGLARGLRAPEAATSPTFALCHHYASTPPLAHVDCWRLVEPAELADLALEEFLDAGGVAVLEWGELALDEYGEDCLLVRLETPAGEPGRRELRFEPRGASWVARLDELGRLLDRLAPG